MDQTPQQPQHAAVQEPAAPKTSNETDESKDRIEKSGKAGKIAIVILSIILALLIIALGLKLIAPDSILSQKIDNMADKVMEFFTGENDTAYSELMIKGENACIQDDVAVYTAEITAGADKQETKTLTISV